MNQTHKAYSFIKQRIMDGHYRPSEKLVEGELASTIGVSRNTVKKALLELEKEQLVEIEVNKGAKIKSFTIEEVINYLEIREVLEGLAIRSVAERITTKELSSLHETLRHMEQIVESGTFEEYPSYNMKFHEIIYNASSNRQAVELIRTIKTQLTRYQFRVILLPHRNETSLVEHRTIFETLQSRDPEAAEKEIRNHIRNVRHLISKYYRYLL